MSGAATDQPKAEACVSCLRRSWLLAALGGPLDYRCRDGGRLMDALALGDQELIRALAGKRRSQLQAQYTAFAADPLPRPGRIEVMCRHDDRYPPRLRFASAPRALHLAHSAQRLHELTRGPVVAVVGSRRASDYGMETARSLARGLAAAGVTLACELEDGIAVAALAGAVQADGAAVCAMPGGVDIVAPAKRRSLYERLTRRGCAVSELPCGSPARRWGHVASQRVIVGLAELTVLVEAEDSPRELAPARLARALGRGVAAIPGRVTSPLSAGTNALLAQGASLLRGPADALELLLAGGADARRAKHNTARRLEPRLQRMLDHVRGGLDTPDRLRRDGEDVGGVLCALSELELMGLLARGDGGRYVPRDLPVDPA
jgi:DNA processing protein